MRHKVCSVVKRVTTEKGPRYCNVVQAANGRIKPHWVHVDGKQEEHTEGAYYLVWYEGTRTVRISIGNDPAEASAQRQRKEIELNAIAAGLPIGKEQSGGNSLSEAITDYLKEIQLTKKPKTYAAYKTALDYFKESCHRLHMEDITRTDMLKFSAFLRDEKEQSPRSVYNKFENVMSFLKSQGIRGLVGKKDWPRYTEEEPEIFEKDELDTSEVNEQRAFVVKLKPLLVVVVLILPPFTSFLREINRRENGLRVVPKMGQILLTALFTFCWVGTEIRNLQCDLKKSPVNRCRILFMSRDSQ